MSEKKTLDVSSINSIDPSNDNSANSTNSENLHEYHGFDQTAEEEIRELARTLTIQSVNNASVHESINELENQSIFTPEMEGINPVFTNPANPGYNPKLDPVSEDFSSKAWVQNMANISLADPDFYKPYSLGCVWKNLSASGESSDVAYQSTFLNMPYKILSTGYRKLKSSKTEDLSLIHI